MFRVRKNDSRHGRLTEGRRQPRLKFGGRLVGAALLFFLLRLETDRGPENGENVQEFPGGRQPSASGVRGPKETM